MVLQVKQRRKRAKTVQMVLVVSMGSPESSINGHRRKQQHCRGHCQVLYEGDLQGTERGHGAVRKFCYREFEEESIVEAARYMRVAQSTA